MAARMRWADMASESGDSSDGILSVRTASSPLQPSLQNGILVDLLMHAPWTEQRCHLLVALLDDLPLATLKSMLEAVFTGYWCVLNLRPNTRCDHIDLTMALSDMSFPPRLYVDFASRYLEDPTNHIGHYPAVDRSRSVTLMVNDLAGRSRHVVEAHMASSMSSVLRRVFAVVPADRRRMTRVLAGTGLMSSMVVARTGPLRDALDVGHGEHLLAAVTLRYTWIFGGGKRTVDEMLGASSSGSAADGNSSHDRGAEKTWMAVCEQAIAHGVPAAVDLYDRVMSSGKATNAERGELAAGLIASDPSAFLALNAEIHATLRVAEAGPAHRPSGFDEPDGSMISEPSPSDDFASLFAEPLEEPFAEPPEEPVADQQEEPFAEPPAVSDELEQPAPLVPEEPPHAAPAVPDELEQPAAIVSVEPPHGAPAVSDELKQPAALVPEEPPHAAPAVPKPIDTATFKLVKAALCAIDFDLPSKAVLTKRAIAAVGDDDAQVISARIRSRRDEGFDRSAAESYIEAYFAEKARADAEADERPLDAEFCTHEDPGEMKPPMMGCEPTVYHGTVDEASKTRLSGLVNGNDFDGLRRWTWGAVTWRKVGEVSLESAWAQLGKVLCRMNLVDGDGIVSALLFHGNQRMVKLPAIDGLELVQRSLFQWSSGRGAVTKQIAEMFELHCRTGSLRIADMKPLVENDDEVKEPPCIKSVMFKLRGLGKEQLFEMHGVARIAAAKHRKTATTEQLDLLAAWDDICKILALQRDNEQNTIVRYLRDKDWPEYPDGFDQVALDAIRGFTWCEVTLQYKWKTLRQLVEDQDWWTHMCMLSRLAGCGKTRLVFSLAGICVEENLTFDDEGNPRVPEDMYFVTVRVADSLKDADSMMAKGVPIVLDEFAPSDVRAQGQCTGDTLKSLLDAKDRGGANSRYKAAKFSDGQPRFGTTNKSFGEWLPVDVTTPSPTQRTQRHPQCLYAPDVEACSDLHAVERRMYWFSVDRRVIAESASERAVVDIEARKRAARANRERWLASQSASSNGA